MQFVVRRLAFYVVAAWFAVTLNFLIRARFRATSSTRWSPRLGRRCHPPASRRSSRALASQPGKLLHQYFGYLGNLATATSPVGRAISREGEHDPRDTLRGRSDWSARRRSSPSSSARCSDPRRLAARRPLRHDAAGFTFLQAMPYFFLAELLVLLLANHCTSSGHGWAVTRRHAGLNWPFINSVLYHSWLPFFTIVITSMAAGCCRCAT